MIRPPRSSFKPEANGTLSTTSEHGPKWFIFKKGDLGKEKAARRAAWDKDGNHYYFTCPSCFLINEVFVDGRAGTSWNGFVHEYSFIHNGRDLDSFSCEVCRSCRNHMWVTLENAVERKLWGALKRDKTQCPKCRKMVLPKSVPGYVFDEMRAVRETVYSCCGIRWK